MIPRHMIPRNAGACQDGTALVNQAQNTSHYQDNAFRIFENFARAGGFHLYRRFEYLAVIIKKPAVKQAFYHSEKVGSSMDTTLSSCPLPPHLSQLLARPASKLPLRQYTASTSSIRRQGSLQSTALVSTSPLAIIAAFQKVHARARVQVSAS